MQSWLSLGLGLLFAWLIVTFLIPARAVSYYTLQPWPLEVDNSNLALIGVGLATLAPAPSRPSVMDSTPAPPMKYVMVSSPSARSPAGPPLATTPLPKSMPPPPPPPKPVAPAPAPSPSVVVLTAGSPSPVPTAPLTLSPSA